jgi:hypothetical protein
MDLFLAISQGIGVSIAPGIRAFLPALLMGVLARANLGVDFEGTGYAFLESIGWLAALVVAAGLTTLASRARVVLPVVLIAAVSAIIGAFVFAGSLGDEGYAEGPGLAAGAVCALLGFAASRAFFDRAAERLRGSEREGAVSLIELYAQAAALLVAGLAVLAPPVSYLALGLCVWVLAARRRRAARKYEGLRILR